MPTQKLWSMSATDLWRAKQTVETLLAEPFRAALGDELAGKLDTFHSDVTAAYEDVVRRVSREMGAPFHPGEDVDAAEDM